jgi:hypothetical protein
MVSRYLQKTVVFSVVSAGIITAGIMGFFAACENPFSNNLGAKVDIEPPTIIVETPAAGDYLQGVVRFEGNATAYRELLSAQVKIFSQSQDETRPPLLDWTNNVLVHWKEGGTIKEKEWYYDLDTLNFYGPGSPLEDGLLRIQFRARDKNLFADTVEMVFIVKNEASIVKLTAPDSSKLETEELAQRVGTNTEIRGQIIDRRGIKPGYPRIKIWPASMEQEPTGDDPNWGWAVLFLSGIDDTEHREAALADGPGVYADRYQRPIVRTANFVFQLSEFTIDPVTRHVKYDININGKHKELPSVRYNFRIMTSDAFFYSDATDTERYQYPKKEDDKDADEIEAVGYYPRDIRGFANPVNYGPHYSVLLTNSGIPPTVTLDNSDKTAADLREVPNIYITEPTVRKTLKDNRTNFRLRILAEHETETISRAILRWEHITGVTNRAGFLAWDNIGTEGYVDDTSEETKALNGHQGKDASPVIGKYFEFTADGSHMFEGKPVFSSSTEPYSLIVTVYSQSELQTERKYTLYLDGTSPDVSIRSVMGAFSDPEGDGITNDFGGWVRNSAYTVNGNMQVSVNRTSNMGIASAKWVVEEDRDDYLDDISDLALDALDVNDPAVPLHYKLKKYYKYPTANNMTFYTNIAETPQSGIVRPPVEGAALESDRTNHLKFNTFKPNAANAANNDWHNKSLWLYIIAQDNVQNMGFVLQKIHVDDTTDAPILQVPGMVLATNNNMTLDQLFESYKTPANRNILGSSNDINLSLSDDDGINIAKGNIVIRITDYNVEPANTISLSNALIRSAVNGRDIYEEGNGREWVGALTQRIMAEALYAGQDPLPSRLRDGMYKVEITVNDNENVKIKIDRPAGQPAQPGDIPVSVGETQVYFFAVQSEPPTITVTYPQNGTTQRGQPVTVWGTIQTPFRINSPTITFTPDNFPAPVTPPSNVISPVQLYRNKTGDNFQNPVAALAASGRDANGNYIYYWKADNVNFDPSGYAPGVDWRRLEVTAIDGLGFAGSSGIIEVEVDTKAPEVDIAEFNYNRPPQEVEGQPGAVYLVNGYVPIKISAYDAGGIKAVGEGANDLVHVKWWVLPATSPVPTWATAFPNPAGATGIGGQFKVSDRSGDNYLITLDTRTLNAANPPPAATFASRTYRLYVIAEDNADNFSTAVALQTFTVDQSSDIPVASSVEPNGNVIALKDDEPLIISGIAFDDDGYNEANFTSTTNPYVEIRFPTNSTGTPTWGDTWQQITVANGDKLEMSSDTIYFQTINFEFNVTKNTYFSTDGLKYYQIRLRDEPAAANGGTPPGKNGLARAIKIYPSDTGYYSFTLKNTPPEIYFRHRDPNESHYTDTPPTGGARPVDGTFNKDRPVYRTVDQLAAVVSGYNILSGYVSDGSLVSLSFIYSDNMTDSWTPVVRPISFTASNSIHTWSITNTGATEGWLAPFTSGGEGIHVIAIVATDIVGNEKRVEWTLSKDSSAPEIRPNIPDVIKNEPFVVRGTFYDDYSDVAGTFRYFFNNNYAQSASLNVTYNPEPATKKTGNWSIPIPANLADGTHTVAVWVQDSLGNKAYTGTLPPQGDYQVFNFAIDRTDPALTPEQHMTVNYTGTAYNKLTESARVFSAAGASATDTTRAFTLRGLVYERNLTTLTANINPGGSKAPLVIKLDNIAAGLAGKPAGTTAASFYDGGTIVTPTDNPALPAPTTTQFRIRKALATNEPALDANQTEVPQNDLPNLYVWELEIQRKNFAALVGLTGDDGIVRQISMVAQDTAGRVSKQENWRFKLDLSAPKVEFLNANISAPYTVFNAVNLQGLVSDDTNVQSIEFTLAKWDYTIATPAWRYFDGTAWSRAETTPNTPPTTAQWNSLLSAGSRSSESWTVDSSKLSYYTNIPEGRYRLHIRAVDNSIGAANPGNLIIQYVEFYVDRTDPAIEWLDGKKEFYRTSTGTANGSLVFNVSVSDANTIKSVTAQLRKYGETTAVSNVTVAVTPAAIPVNITANTITVTLTGVSNAFIDQRYTLILTVTDGAGTVSTIDNTIDFLLDNVQPEIKINDSLAAEILEAIAGRVVLRGTFTKVAGKAPISRVAYKVGGTAPAVTDANGILSDTLLYNNGNGWRFNATASDPRFTFDGKRLMEIDQGLATANLLIPDTRNLTTGTTLAPGLSVGQTTPVAGRTITFGGAIASGETVHPLVIHFLAIDEAGNYQVLTQNYWIYPEGDRPVIEAINNPNESAIEVDRLLNGRIRIGGNAKDNARVKYVWFRVIDSDPNSPTSVRDKPVETLVIPRWDDYWSAVVTAGVPQYQSPRELEVPGVGAVGTKSAGWYMANGGGKASVSWWAYINTEGELDPLTSTSRRLTIQVAAEDTIWDDEANGGNGAYDNTPGEGMISRIRPLTTAITATRSNGQVIAYVVQGAPRFEDEFVLNGKRSNATNTEITPNRTYASEISEANGWGSVSTTNVRKKAAYAITIKHDTGVGSINWTPAGSSNAVNLLDTATSNTYVSTTYAQHLAAMDTLSFNETTNPGIAVKATAKNVKTGSITITTGQSRKFMIWKEGALPTVTLQDRGPLTAAENKPYTTFTVDSSVNSFTVGAGVELLQQTPDGTFEWVVIVDINTDIIPYTGGGTWGTVADMFPISLSATEISKSVPLTASYIARIPIDNLPPTAMYSHTANIAGTAPTFGGEAGDRGTVSGLSRVVLWFSRMDGVNGEIFIPWNETDEKVHGTNGKTKFEADTSFTWDGVVNIPATGPGGGVMQFPRTYNNNTGNNYSSVVIDRNDPMGSVRHNAHQIRMGFATIGGDLGTGWYATLDSTKMVSGRIYAHFVVYDKAGNGRYYSQKLMVLNGVPRIARIQLGTDIRGGTGLDLTGAIGAGNRVAGDTRTGTGVGGASTTGTFVTGTGELSALKNIKDRFIARVTGMGAPNPAPSNADVGIGEYITVDTGRLNDYGVVYDDAFTARNNLLALRVETLTPQSSGRPRHFRVEYVADAQLITGAANIMSATGIRAGRSYIINNPGTDFPWGAFGAQAPGDPPAYRKGLAFIAVENGDEATVQAGTYGNPSVWELNRTYYNGVTNPQLNSSRAAVIANMNANLRLPDVTYSTYTATAEDDMRGTYAEFVYGNGAFSGNTTSNTQIRDFNPAAGDFAADGRPRPYPFPSVATVNPWNAHSLFIVRVFDANPGDDELYGDFALLSIKINNNDKTTPYAQLYDLNPKTEEGSDVTARQTGNMGQNRSRGGLYNAGTSAKSGHIEPRGGTSLTSLEMGGAASAGAATLQKPAAHASAFAYFATDTVSGKVFVRGYAEDNQRIKRVDLVFRNGDNNATLTTVPILISAAAQTTTPLPAVGFLTAAANANVSFTEALDVDRHRVEWSYLWDSEATPGGNNVVGNINVRVVAYNNNSTEAANTVVSRTAAAPAAARNTYDYFNPSYPVNTGAAATVNFYRYNEIRVNLRPYITGFLRDTSAHNTRSRQGRYMLARGEIAVVTGFNLLNGAGNTTISLIANNGNTANVGTPGNFGIAANNVRYRQFTVNANQTTGTGMVTLTVNGQPAVNTGSERPRLNPEGTEVQPEASGGRPWIQPWNAEYTAGREGSDLWDDVTAVHIWQSNDGDTGTDNGRFRATNMNYVVMNPAMSIDPANGRLYSSHNEGGSGGSYNTGTVRWSTNAANGTTPEAPTTPTSDNTVQPVNVMQFVDPIVHSDIYRSPGSGNLGAATWVVSSIIGRSGANHFWSALGGIYIHGPGGSNTLLLNGSANEASGNPANANAAGYKNLSLYLGESTWYNASTNSTASTNGNNTGGVATPPTTDQFLNPHIVTSYSGTGNATREHIHVSYYDSKDGSIKYRYNLRTTTATDSASSRAGTIFGGNTNTATTANAIPKMWTNLDGGLDVEDIVATTYTHADVGSTATGSIGANLRVVNYDTRNGQTRPNRANVGEHNAIAVTSAGYPVIAYYDATNARLKLAVSRSQTPILRDQWIIRDNVAIPADGNTMYLNNTGAFVSIAIDPGRDAGSGLVNVDVIHIAAMNSATGNLVYIRGQLNPTAGTVNVANQTQTYNTANNVLTNVTVRVIDNLGTVGRWCGISLDADGNPWIAYQDTGYIGAKDGVKMAYLDQTRFTKGQVTFAGEDMDVNGESLSGWETMHVPTGYRVENPTLGMGEQGRIGVECFPTRRNPTATRTGIGNFAAVSYLSTDLYRIAYYVK